MRHRFRLAVVPLIVVLVSALTPLSATATDSTCNPNLARWYGVFRRYTETVPMLGGRANIQKTTMGYHAPTGQPLNNTLWVITDLNAPNGYGTAWAEIGYGYGQGIPGPFWYYFYVRQNGSVGSAYGLPFDASADSASFEVKL